MPRIFVHTFTVPPDAIDVQGHTNNVEYVRWMQDVAVRHSAAQGWPMERYARTGTGWVVRSHSIEYLQPSRSGDVLSLLTWVAGFRRHSSPRRFLFWRASDRQVLAKAETLWVFVDIATGRPRPIPEELSSAFDIVPKDEDVLKAVPGIS